MGQYYYEYKDDGDVKYCYPGTQVLVNKFDIHNGQQLSKVEREISIVKAAVLADRITGNFDLDFSMAGEGEMLEASVAAFMCNYEKMEALIRKCVKEIDL